MNTHILNFTPTNEESALITRSAAGNHDATMDLVMLDILFSLPFNGWHKVTDQQDLRAFENWRITTTDSGVSVTFTPGDYEALMAESAGEA